MWKFEKSVGGTAINGYSVEKYTQKDGKIKLQIEKYTRSTGQKIIFKNEKQYKKFLDDNTDEDDWMTNRGRVVWNLLEAIRNQ